MKTVHLVDVSNWIYRAYYACAPLTAPDGTPTGALKQFIVMANSLLMKTRDDPNGSYLVFCCDPAGKPTWRHRAIQQWNAEQPKKDLVDIYGDGKSHEYKGNRNKDGLDDLRPQIRMAYDVLKMAGFCVIRKPPYECDDIMGTLAHRLCHKNLVKMYSRDKDFTQLLDHENIELIMPKQGNVPERILNIDNVQDFFGVPVENIVDMLALAGDKVDNIPGIPGVGEGTARKLILEHGNINSIRKSAKAGKIKSKAVWLKALRGEVPHMDLDLMRELVTIDRNVPRLPKTIQECRVGPSDDAKLKKLKKKLNFNQIFHI